MNILKNVLKIFFIILVLFLQLSTFKNQHQDYYGAGGKFIYSRGNAPEAVRTEIIDQLHAFQEGYTKRDTSLLGHFMDQLFSRESIVILGTMPQEIYVGFDEATYLVESDWLEWGDCRFIVDNAQVSSAGNVAWLSTIGYVEFDLSRFLVWPLRLSAVTVKEGGVWKFQQVQFQFDLNLVMSLGVIILLLSWLLGSILSLTVPFVLRLIRPERTL